MSERSEWASWARGGGGGGRCSENAIIIRMSEKKGVALGGTEEGGVIMRSEKGGQKDVGRGRGSEGGECGWGEERGRKAGVGTGRRQSWEE